MKNKNIIIVVCLVIVLSLSINQVQAAGDWWGHATDFLNGYNGSNTTIGGTTVGNITTFLDPLVGLVRVIGNMIFIAVTVFLGIKYIWGSVDSKAEVKESITTLAIATLVFYGWNTISALFMTGEKLSILKSSAEATANEVYGTLLYVDNFLAVGGLIYVGLRYMLARAEGKAQLKTNNGICYNYIFKCNCGNIIKCTKERNKYGWIILCTT